jgi:exodeoxyribonuclease VII small subunit
MSEGVTTLSFEAAVGRLEEIVAAMESGSLTLDESMRQFEEAVSLSRHCAGRLDAAEKQISVLEAEDYLRTATEIPRVKEDNPEDYDPFAD